MNSIWVREDGTITDSDDPTAFEYISVEEYGKLEKEASGLRVALSNLQHARSSRYYKVKADRDAAVERAIRAHEENERFRAYLEYMREYQNF